MANLITIKQLLESIDLDFEPRFVTKDEDGTVNIWEEKPEQWDDIYRVNVYNAGKVVMCPKLKLAEFKNKNWVECIYEIPSKTKTTNKIDKLTTSIRGFDESPRMPSAIDFFNKINEIIDAINKLMEE